VRPSPEFASTAAKALLGNTGLGDVAGDVLEKLLGGKSKRRH
jgi:hypothetical protein